MDKPAETTTQPQPEPPARPALKKLSHSSVEDLKVLDSSMTHLARRTAVPDFLYLEPVNICNANCVFCGYQFDRRPKAIMPDEFFKRAVDDFADHGGQRVGLSPFAGEIFLDRGILDKIAYLRTRGFAHVHTYTNASRLHKFGVERVLRSGLTELHVSAAPLEAALYKRIYRNNTYQRVLRNLHDLFAAFAALTDKTVRKLSLEFRSDRSLAECRKLTDFREYVEPVLSDEVDLSAMCFFDSCNGMIKPEDLPPGMTLRTHQGSKLQPCGRIFNVQVLVDGSLRLCGCRYDHTAPRDELNIGHLDTTTPVAAYRSPQARRIINSFVTGNCPRICAGCGWYGL